MTPPEPTDPLLRSLAAATAAADEALAAAAEPDRLLLDLAERLWKHGLLVEADHGIPGGDRIPLVVGHPDLPGEMLVAVLTDDEEYTAEPSVRVRDRLTADRLERVGWSVVRVWSAAAFMDPQAEVDRIRRAVHARVPAPAAPRSAPLQLGLIDEADDAEELPTPASSARSAARAAARAAAHPASRAPRRGCGRRSRSSRRSPLRVLQRPPAGVRWQVRARSLPVRGATPAAADPAGRPSAQPVPRPATMSPVPRAPTMPPVPTCADPAASAHDDGAAGLRAAGPTTPPVPPATTRTRPAVRSSSRSRCPPGSGPTSARGLPIGAYSDDQLDELVAWLQSDEQERTREQLAAALRDELGITRRSYRIDTAVRSAITRGDALTGSSTAAPGGIIGR